MTNVHCTCLVANGHCFSSLGVHAVVLDELFKTFSQKQFQTLLKLPSNIELPARHFCFIRLCGARNITVCRYTPIIMSCQFSCLCHADILHVSFSNYLFVLYMQLRFESSLPGYFIV